MNNSIFLIKTSLSTALLFATLACHANQIEIEIDQCVKITNNQQIFECSQINKINADKNLNDQYKKLLGRVKNQYRSDQKIGKDLTDKIKKSQRAWIILRDSNCEVESHEIEVGTPAYEVTNNNCISRESIQRTEYLKKIAPDI